MSGTPTGSAATTSTAALTEKPAARIVGGDGLPYPAPPADPALRGTGGGPPAVVVVYVGTTILAGGLTVAAGMAAGLLGTAAVAAGLIFYLRRRSRAVGALLARSAAALGARELKTADALLREAVRRSRGNRALHVLCVFQLAALHLLRGENERALELMAVAHRSSAMRRLGQGLGAAVPFYIASCFAQAGDNSGAAAWLAAAEKSADGVAAHLVASARAIVRARSGDYAQTREVLERAWPALESGTTVDHVKAMRILLAFAIERLAPSTGGAVDKARVDDLLAGATPLGFEANALLAPWAELREWALAKLPGEKLPEPR